MDYETDERHMPHAPFEYCYCGNRIPVGRTQCWKCYGSGYKPASPPDMNAKNSEEGG